MPGAARMYPETDHPLLKISKKIIDRTKKELPKISSEHKSYLREFGLNDELIKLIVKQNKIEDFKTLTKVIDNPKLIAKSLTIFQSSSEIDLHILEAILEEVGKKISENDVKIVLQKISQGESIKEAMKKSSINLTEEIKKLIKEKPGLSEGAYMGLIMNKFKGQIGGKEVSDVLKKLL